MSQEMLKVGGISPGFTVNPPGFVVGELSNVARGTARWLIGPEMLALQGFPVDELNLEGIKDQQLRLLAGGATGCHKFLLGRLKYNT